MTTHNTAARATAIALGVALTAGGTSLLFGDVIFGSVDFTQKHFQTITIVLGTLLAAHVAKEAWISRHWPAVLGFAAIAAAGTGLICYNSLGRQAEGVMVASADHDKTVRERTTIEADLAGAKADLKKYREAADTECKSGEGPKCRSTRASRDFYDDSVKGYEARLKQLALPKVVDPSAERFGDYAAALGYDKEKAKTVVMLIVPYLITLLFEFGTVISFGYGFSPTRRAPATELGSVTDAELFAFRQRFVEPEQPNGSPKHPRDGSVAPKRPVGPKPNGSRFTKEEAAADLVTRLALGECFGSQDELRERYGVAKSTMSDWLTDWTKEGIIPARTVQGRCKALAS